MKKDSWKILVLAAYTTIVGSVYVHDAKKDEIEVMAAAEPVVEEEEVVELSPVVEENVDVALAVSDSKDIRIIYTKDSKPIVLEKVSDDPVYYRELTCLLLNECELYEGSSGSSSILIIPTISDQIVSGADVDKIFKDLSEESAENSVSANVVSDNSVSENTVSDNTAQKKDAAKKAASNNNVPVGSDTYSGVPVEWDGGVLTKNKGVNMGPSGKETYYNLPMDGIVNMMRSMGNTDEHWIREDGVHMLGDYVMVAANLQLRPRGSYIATSVGMGVVVDTGGFAAMNPTQLDIATTW